MYGAALFTVAQNWKLLKISTSYRIDQGIPAYSTKWTPKRLRILMTLEQCRWSHKHIVELKKKKAKQMNRKKKRLFEHIRYNLQQGNVYLQC